MGSETRDGHANARAAAVPGSARGGRIDALSPGLCARETPPIVLLRRDEPGYPDALRDLSDPPALLHTRGGALPRVHQAVAIVGARAATPYGLRIAEQLSRDLVAQGVVVVSGLARGIDAAAHAGALAADGRTVAVIASSLDQVTPPEHATLAERIARSGVVMSEVAAGGPFGRGAFVKRNRLVAALCAVTVVVEASERSGALTTATFARELGRSVLAVPGDLDRHGSRGTLALLRGGARPCGDAGDVLTLLGGGDELAADPDARLRARLGAEPVTVEALALGLGLQPAEALARLLRLQWSGLAVAHPGGRWSARAGCA